MIQPTPSPCVEMVYIVTSLFNTNHDKCVLDYVHGVNVLSKSKPAKHKNKEANMETYRLSKLSLVFGLRMLQAVDQKLLSANQFRQHFSWVYYVDGLRYNLFSVGQLCDSDLELAFHKYTCFVRNLEGVDLLTGSGGTNLYTLSIGDMMKSSPICLLSKDSKTNYYEEVSISHETSLVCTLQQNGVVKRRNRTLLEAARTMLIYAKAPLFLWAEAVATTYLSYLYVFGILCYPTNDSEDLVIPPDVKEANHDIEVAHMDNNLYFGLPILEPSSKESSSHVVTLNNVHLINQPPEHINKWTKDHPIDNVIGDPSRPVSTRHQLQTEALFYYFDVFLSFVEPKSYKEALTESYGTEAMQEELNEFERLKV
ncbi:retrovirus-related pol polyprotein from transposon TNT 1-94 [Tanacetum coccineum]|uniref:Retrovirus-related pol polyprotein from transposon TNT 1-94 n=1 Tax=Tanacetum coccineum TaxID=301880 RepID=A0ABQ5DXZ5_9ASTR